MLVTVKVRPIAVEIGIDKYGGQRITDATSQIWQCRLKETSIQCCFSTDASTSKIYFSFNFSSEKLPKEE